LGDLLVIMVLFVIKINLGNDAMLTGYDIAGALREIAIKIYDNEDMREFTGVKNIRDINGNTVGSWSVK
jgi:hypothetical protein